MSSGIIDLIKKVAVNAFEASNPVKLLFGKVISTEPYKIQVSEMLTLSQEFLVINGTLSVGDTVTLIRCQGGQQYVVLGGRVNTSTQNHNYGGVVTSTNDGAWQYPFKNGYTKTSDFGWRRLNGKDGYHKGVDLVGKVKHIYPVNDGTVVYTKTSNSGYGNHILVKHDGGVWSLYAHLSQIYVKSGQTVNKNTILGVEGSTGDSTGSHLHLEIRQSEGGSQIDPITFLSTK